MNLSLIRTHDEVEPNASVCSSLKKPLTKLNFGNTTEEEKLSLSKGEIESYSMSHNSNANTVDSDQRLSIAFK